MAHSRRRGASHARSKPGVKNQIWTTLMLDAVSIAAAGTLDLNIVEAADWAFVDGQRATLMTIRGYLSFSFSNSLVASAEGSLLGLIAHVDAGVALPPPPDIAATYVATNILDTFGYAIPEVAANVVRQVKNHEVNVKTKRIFSAREQIRLVIKNNGVNTVEVTGVCRALIRKND